MSSSSADRNPVELLAEEFAQRLRRGETPSLSEYVLRYPEHADEIREVFPALVLMEQLKPVSDDRTSAFPRLEADRRLQQLGDYHIVREIGRGGMGVVYEAEQVSLGRHVALKVLPAAALLNPTFLERFRREARAAAGLHHTNIVPVFGVGESDGFHYYAMQFIPGEGLDRVLRDLRRLRPVDGASTPGRDLSRVARTLLTGCFAAPVETATDATTPREPGTATRTASNSEAGYYRGMARVGLQVAEALAYAHRHGVLHRDIKPSNLLLDLQGTVWITDFGLAKAEGSDELTQTGDIVGTLRFMAPERFDGQSLPQSDVYALGVTLYEMLTLKPAFEDANKARLIDQVLHEMPLSPRKLDAGIPRDLETVVLKCLAKIPAERYASAEALAEDLRRFLADRPIRARRTPWHERAWRWCRRNPWVSGLSAALLLVLSATAVVGVGMSLRLIDALGQAQAAERDGKRKLLAAYIAETDARSMSRRAGQRFGSLQRVRKALDVAQDIGLSQEDRLRLRNVAIAALCLPDVETDLEWPIQGEPPEGLDPIFRRRLRGHQAIAQIPDSHVRLEFETGYSLDGKFVALGREGYHHQFGGPVRVWRIDGPRPVRAFDAPDGPYEHATSFRPDGRQVAFGHRDGTASIYDTETGHLVRRLEKRPGAMFCLAYHPRLPRLAVSNGPEVTIWDLESGQSLVRFRCLADVTAIAWHPRGHRLATAGADASIQLWGASAGRPVTSPWQGHRSHGIRLAFSHAGDRLLSNDWLNVLRLWDTATGQLLVSLPESPELRFGSDDQTLGPRLVEKNWRVLRLAGGQELRALHRPTSQGHETFQSFSLHRDGRLLAIVTGSGLGFFDLLTGEELAFARGRFAHVHFDQTGALWTVGAAGALRWPVRTSAGRPHSLRVGPPEWVSDVSNEGQVPAGSGQGFAVSGDGQILAVPVPFTHQGAVLVHRGPPRRVVRTDRDQPQDDVRCCVLSPDGRFVATRTHWHGVGHPRCKLWNTQTGGLVADLPFPEIDTVHGFSSDSRWMYVSGKEDRRLDVASLTPPTAMPAGPPTPLPPHWRSESLPGNGALSPDEQVLAVAGDDGQIRLVAPGLPGELARLSSPEVSRIFPTTFSSDGSLLLARGEDTGTLYVYDLRLLRGQLAELDLDWAAPPYRPARPEQARPALAPPLEVELKGAEAAANRQ